MTEASIVPEQGRATALEHPPQLLEICIVAMLTVGLMLGRWLWVGTTAINAYAFTNRHLYSVVGYEIVLAAIFVPILRRRGWDPAAIAGLPAPVDLLRGLALLLGGYASYILVWIFFARVHPHIAFVLATDHRYTGAAAGPLAIALTALINPAFEELLWLGYFVQRLQPRIGWRGAALVSLALRCTVHIYQGPVGQLGVLLTAVVFTWYYIRTRRIWPVIVAHACVDVIGLVIRLRHGH